MYADQVPVSGDSILLVDDTPENLRPLSGILKAKDYSIRSLRKGQMVFSSVLSAPMDGYEATRRIRECERTSTRSHQHAQMPIIAMTAHAISSEIKRCLDVGMNDHISKPIDPEQLFSVSRKWVKPKNGTLEKQLCDSPPPSLSHRLPVPGPQLPTSLPGLDVADGLKRVAGNEKLYRKLLLQFREDRRHVAEQLKDALSRGNTEDALRLAHTIKGVAGNIGAMTLFEASTELERALTSSEDRQIARCVIAFETA